MAESVYDPYQDRLLNLLASNPIAGPVARTLQDQYASSNGIDKPDFAEDAGKVINGDMTATELQHKYVNGFLTPEQETLMNNLLSQEASTTAYERDKEFAQQSLLWDADQLGQLGLGAQGVLQTGGTTGSNQASKVDYSDNAQARYERSVAVAKSMISLAGSLAGAGIHGAALSGARKAASFASYGASRYAFKL